MAITRISRHEHSDPNVPTHQQVGVMNLHVEPMYQRDLIEHRVRRMAREWDLRQAGTVTVARRANGRLVVIDGQHRVAAARLVNPNMVLMCVIWEGLTLAQEAELFTNTNRSRKSLTPPELFKADLIAGQFEATDIQRIAHEHGFKVATGTVGHGRVNAITALRSVYRMGDRKGVILSEVLRLHRAAWGDEVPTAATIHGFATFLSRYKDRVDTDRLRRVLAGELPERIIAQGKGRAGMMSVSTPIGTGMAVADLYNKRLRTGRLPEWR